MTTPITIHPDNPHYFLFRSKPAILITSAEHYGAVINRQFDYVRYLDTLAAHRLNYTRIYPGALIEREGDFIPDNILAPRDGQHLLPWARSSTPGYALGGNKFDLDTWDEAFFARLDDFIAQAAAREIVVEICFFNCQNVKNWHLQAFHADSNIQGSATCGYLDFQTLNDAALVRYQDAYVAEITRRVNAFDNVILEICDEPGLYGTPAEDYHAWISHLIDVVQHTEAALPNKHLIAQQVCGTLGGLGDFSDDPRVGLNIGQYIISEAGSQFGGMILLDTEYEHDKPLELNESAYYPVWYIEDREAASRVEAWEFIIGGGAGYNHLNGIFTIFNPTGKDHNNAKVLTALTNLRNFIESFDFIRMRRDTTSVTWNAPDDAHSQCLSEIGYQYAFYTHRARHRVHMYVVHPGLYQDAITIDLPSGDYALEWHDPEQGIVIKRDQFRHNGGKLTLRTPPYRIDIALKITGAPKDYAVWDG